MWNSTDRQICRSMLSRPPLVSWRQVTVGAADRLRCGRERRFKVRRHRTRRHRERDRMGDLRRHRLLLIASVLRRGAADPRGAAATSNGRVVLVRGMCLLVLVTIFVTN